MKKNKKLLTRIMASVMTGMLLFGQVSPVFAQDTEESAAVTDESKWGNVRVNMKDVPSFTYSDGTIYYPAGLELSSLKDVNKAPSRIMNTNVEFEGWEDEHMSGPAGVSDKWLRLGSIIQMNSDLGKFPGQKGVTFRGGLYDYSANSLASAEHAVVISEDDRGGGFRKPNFKSALGNENKSQYVLGCGAKYNVRGVDDGDYAYLVAYLYNFRYTPMLTDEYLNWASKNGGLNVDDNTSASKEAGVGCFNDTPLQKTDSQAIEDTKTQTSTKEDNGSFGHSYSAAAKVGVEGQGGAAKVSVELSFTASMAFSKGWSKSESASYEKKITNSQSVTLLPYSAVNLATSTQGGTYKQTIDFPLALSYDVKLVSYGTDKHPETVVLATYEGRRGSKDRTDAQSDLYQRYFKGQEDQNVKYKGDAYPFDPEGTISICAKTVPFFVAKETSFDGKVNDKKIEAKDFIALHPLRSVDTTEKMRSLPMKPGTVYQGRDIPVFGYLDKKYSDGDGKTGKYSAFNREQGHWELKSGEGIIEITLDGQNRQQIKALKEGEATIIYRINENVYNSNENRTVFASNKGLEATAEMTVTVSKTAAEDTSGFINQGLHALENDGTGWTVDDGYILGSEDGDALTDATVPVSGLEGIQLEAKGNTLDSRDGLESVQYSLTGENADNYDVYYRSYVKDLGWMNWASNDQLSGTSGYDKEITAVQVMILEKDITPTADDSVTLGFFMENTDNSDPAVIFAQLKEAHEENPKPAKNVITYSTDSADEDSESNDDKVTDSTDTEEGKNGNKEDDLGDKINEFFDSIGDRISNLFNPDSEDN